MVRIKKIQDINLELSDIAKNLSSLIKLKKKLSVECPLIESLSMHTVVTCLTDHGGVQQRTPSGDLDSKLLRHVRRAGVLGRGDGLILQGHSGGGSFRRDEHVSTRDCMVKISQFSTTTKL